MQIWVDADACPGPVKEIIVRTALRLQIKALFVSDKYVHLEKSDMLSYISVEQGMDSADKYIVATSLAGDLAVTQDIPLAALLCRQGVAVIDPRGIVHTPNSVGDRLATRNLMTDLRDAGMVTGGPAPFGPKDRQRFSDSLDRELTRLRKHIEQRAKVIANTNLVHI
ncbi:MAG: YaiI/YqxD family protein [Rhodospirillaceae bacterium]